MALLAMLGLFLVQVLASTNRSSSYSNRSVDAAAQARIAFERIGIDLDNMVKRADADAVFTNSLSGTAKNLLLFYSTVTAPGLSSAANRGVSLVSYRVQIHPDNNGLICLQRAAKPVPLDTSSWGTQAFMGLQASGLPVPLNMSDPSFPIALTAADADYDILAQGVFRMVVGFQLRPDNNSVTLQDNTSFDHAMGQLVYSPPVRVLQNSDKTQTATLVDIDRIGAVVVGLVAIDGETIRNMGTAHSLTETELKSLADDFAVPDVNQLPADKWSPVADSLASSTSLPAPVRNVRVFQRAFPMTRPNVQAALP